MSTNEEHTPPSKPRASPLDFRNTDLVSRLLAATPPYLYNMSMVPNTYFFSEMLRSFVQAKTDAARAAAAPTHHRRSRKRSWTQSRAEYYPKESPKADKPEIPSPNWNHKPPEKTTYFDNKPLELTMDKNLLNNNRLSEIDYHNQKMLTATNNIRMDQMDKSIPNPHIPMMFPNMPQNQPQEPNQNLILPPPPPIWYPPIYPPPYGIDPLHFFIDLRVSGHIYDRKNGKETSVSPLNPQATSTHTSPIAEMSSPPLEGFKQSRHASAFSVPLTAATKNIPINLSNNKHEYAEPKENKPLKFDIKSMGFEKISNKTSTSYVMNNISRIYTELNVENQMTYKSEPEELRPESNELRSEDKEETEEEKAKRVKDLRALIGLELVVDYMNHAKPGQQMQTISEDSTSDNESAASPALEVVAIQDDIPQGI